MSGDAPEWLISQVQTWRERLWLEGWSFTVGLSPTPAGDTENLGCCRQQPNLNRARLTFRDDIEEGANAEVTVIHELHHVGHSLIDQFVTDVLIPQLAPAAREIAQATYRNLVEAYTERLAQSAYALAHGDVTDESASTTTE